MKEAAHRLASLHQLLQRRNVSPVISRLVNRRLRDESSVGEPRVIQQSTERIATNSALPDMLMAVKL
jgi:hypothetical protein